MVAAGIEGRDVVLPAAQGNAVVHAGHEAVHRSDVAQHFNVRLAAQFEPPGAAARADAVRQPLVSVALLKVLGVEVDRCPGVNGQRRRTVRHPIAVEGEDFHHSRIPASVHHPDEALLLGMGCGREKRYRVDCANHLKFHAVARLDHQHAQPLSGQGRHITVRKPFGGVDVSAVQFVVTVGVHANIVTGAREQAIDVTVNCEHKDCRPARQFGLSDPPTTLLDLRQVTVADGVGNGNPRRIGYLDL